MAHTDSLIAPDATRESPRVLGVLVGDIRRQPDPQVKYSLFFNALAKRVSLVGVFDAALRGAPRLINALMVWHPNRQRWRERFRINPSAFRWRSARVASHLRSLSGRVDVILQLGAMFDSRWNESNVPCVVYADYTARLSAQRPEGGRLPLSHSELKRWLALERATYERAHHICTRSRLVAHSMAEDYGIARERITPVGGGVNFLALPDPVARPDDAAPTALFIGREFNRKGGDILLRAFTGVREQIPNARLLLVTAGHIPPELSLAGVEVIAPTWDRAAIAALYRQADIFVLPSRLETWGDVLLEAMAFGLPCIGVAGHSMEDIVDEGRTGHILPASDADALATAMIRMMSNRQLCREWGMAAHRRVKNEFTWDHVIQRMEPFLRAAADGARRKREGFERK